MQYYYWVGNCYITVSWYLLGDHMRLRGNICASLFYTYKKEKWEKKYSNVFCSLYLYFKEEYGFFVTCTIIGVVGVVGGISFCSSPQSGDKDLSTIFNTLPFIPFMTHYNAQCQSQYCIWLLYSGTTMNVVRLRYLEQTLFLIEFNICVLFSYQYIYFIKIQNSEKVSLFSLVIVISSFNLNL